MKQGDEASPSRILAGRALLVKKLITLKPFYAFGSKKINLSFFYSFFHIYFIIIIISFSFFAFLIFLCFFKSLTLSSYWYAKR